MRFSYPRKFNLILLNSAYHHIENHRKLLFLENVKNLLAPDGLVFVGEHFLPPYRNFRASVDAFYQPLIEYLHQEGVEEAVIDIIRSSMRYTVKRRYEYKASYRRFLCDFASRRFSEISRISVWQHPLLSPNAGTFLVVLRRSL